MKNYIVFTRWGGHENHYMTEVKPYHNFDTIYENKAIRMTQKQAMKIVHDLNKEARSCNSFNIYGYSRIQ